MSYRAKTEIYGDDDDPVQRSAWLKRTLFFGGYVVILIWLWAETDFPHSLGVDIAAHGKAGALLSWYYSYLLLERHALLDIVTFAFMWAPVAGFAWWIALEVRKDRQAKRTPTTNFNKFSNSDAE